MLSEKLNIKFIAAVIAGIILVFTIALCIASPQIHKPFEIIIIKNIIKINADGSTSVTKEITTTKIREK